MVSLDMLCVNSAWASLNRIFVAISRSRVLTSAKSGIQYRINIDLNLKQTKLRALNELPNEGDLLLLF